MTPLRKVDLKDPLVTQLATELRHLDAMPTSTKEERVAWSSAAAEFEKRLRTDWSSIYDSLPHELEHYLVDDDIRAKDLGYAQHQRKKLSTLLMLDEEKPNQSPAPASGLICSQK